MHMFKLKPCNLEFVKTGTCYFENSIVIASSPETVFDVIALINPHHKWLPWFKKAYWLSDGIPAIGKQRVFQTYYINLLEEIIDCKRGKRLCFWVSEASIPLFSQFLEDYQLTQLETGETSLIWRIYCTPHRQIKLLYPLINFLLGRDFKKGCQNIKMICEKENNKKNLFKS